MAHACIELIRERKRRVIEVELTPATIRSTLDASALVADRDQLDRVLARLEPESRAVVVLYFYLDLPMARIADVLGMPIGTAKSRLHRSLGLMRSTMAIEAAANGAVRGDRGGPVT